LRNKKAQSVQRSNFGANILNTVEKLAQGRGGTF
jgi:hypothetical protein